MNMIKDFIRQQKRSDLAKISFFVRRAIAFNKKMVGPRYILDKLIKTINFYLLWEDSLYLTGFTFASL